MFNVSNDSNEVAIYTSDGTAPGTNAAGIYPDYTGYSTLSGLIAVGGKVYYGYTQYAPPQYTAQPTFSFYVTDGTAAGTITLSSQLPNKLQYAVLGNKLIFYGTSTVFSGQPALWATDGTKAGTVPLLKKNFYADCYNNFHFTNFNNKLYFSCTFDSSANTLWQTDGTVAGTLPVIGFSGITSNVSFGSIATNGNYMYFKAWDSTSGRVNLWYSDGSATGTYAVTYPQANGFLTDEMKICSALCSPVTLVDSTIYYGINYDTANTGFELYTMQRATSANNIKAAASTFTVYPNPANNSFQVNQQFAGSEICDLAILDVQGRVVRQLMQNKTVSSGTFVATYPSDYLPDGVYFIRLKTQSNMEVTKLIVQH